MKNLTNKDSAAKRPKPRRASGATSVAQATQTSAAPPSQPRRASGATSPRKRRNLGGSAAATSVAQATQTSAAPPPQPRRASGATSVAQATQTSVAQAAPTSAAKRPKPRRASGATSVAQATQTSAAPAAQTSAAKRPKLRRQQAAIAIAGMGLIGGSFYKAAKRAGHDVVGFDKGDPVDVRDADVVFVALAPQTAVDWIRLHASEFKDGAAVIDTCGIKRPVCQALAGVEAGHEWTFIGGHPMAGKEVSGFANSDADLFKGASMILTPRPNTSPALLDRLRMLFAELGFGRTVITTPEHHDEIIAFTSQLCHIISSAYVREPLALEHDGFSAGSFRDMVRVGAPSPALWSELFAANREALVPVLDRYIARLADFRAAIANDDRSALVEQLAEGHDIKGRLTAEPSNR